MMSEVSAADSGQVTLRAVNGSVNYSLRPVPVDLDLDKEDAHVYVNGITPAAKETPVAPGDKNNNNNKNDITAAAVGNTKKDKLPTVGVRQLVSLQLK